MPRVTQVSSTNVEHPTISSCICCLNKPFPWGRRWVVMGVCSPQEVAILNVFLSHQHVRMPEIVYCLIRRTIIILPIHKEEASIDLLEVICLCETPSHATPTSRSH